MARTVSFSQSGGVVPYIHVVINSVDYSSRVEYVEHHEEAYRDRAVIGLNNRDNSLDASDLDGEVFKIGYGYGGQYVDTAPLWVKSHQIISVEGERIYQIYAEGAWIRLREQKVIAGVTGDQADLYSNTFDGTHTVYGLLDLIIEGAMSWDLVDSPPDDGIIDSFHPVFDINQMPFEMAAALIYRLMWMTRCFLRVEAISAGVNYPRFRVIYPHTDDAVDETYYSDQVHYFTEYDEKTILLIPNSIVVLCNQDPNGLWDTDAYPLIVGTAKDQDQIDKYGAAGTEIVHAFLAGNIRTQTDADNRAAAILSKLKAEILAGRGVVQHDARVELYDRAKFVDRRT